MLGHDMLNGVLTTVQPIIDLFVLRAIAIFQALEDICLISGRHRVDVLIFKPLSKIFICWEGCLLLLVSKNIPQFLDKIVVGAIETLDVIAEREEHLALGIGRQIANEAAKQIGLYDAADFTHIL